MSVPALSSAPRPRGKSRWYLLALIIFGGAGVFALAQGRLFAPKPRLIGKADSVPLSIRYAGNAWYWREQTKDASERLMRLSPSGSQVVAQADAIPCYALAEGKLGWVERKGKEWTILLAEADGSTPRSFWKSAEEPMGIAIAQGRVYWLQRLPAPAPESGSFPSLQSSQEVVSMPLSGESKPNSMARLWESDAGEILGLHADTLFVAAYRQTQPGSVCIYRIPQGEEHPVRIAAERGFARPLLTRTGDLYWTAPSEEASGGQSAVCLRRLAANGQVETLSDWLPYTGEIYETTHGVFYKDKEVESALWAAGRQDSFPSPVVLPAGFRAVAAGEEVMLLAPANSDSLHFPLYEMPLP